MSHRFLFGQATWIGEGRITFSVSPDHIRFFTRWTFQSEEDGVLKWVQEVEMHGSEDKVTNEFTIYMLTDTTFSITYENDTIGRATGKGVITPQKIAWEIRNPEAFQGFEVYEVQENGDYKLHAEYVADDNFRTIIDALVWPKST